MTLAIGPVSDVSWSSLGRVVSRFRRHLAPHRGRLVLGAAAVLALTIVELLRPFPLKLVFDYVLMPGSRTRPLPGGLETQEPGVLLAIAALGVVLLSLFAAAFSYAQSVLLAAVGQKVTGALRLELFSHVQRLPQSYHDYRQSGELLMRLTGDINQLKDLLVTMLATLTSRFALLVGMLVAMALLNLRLTLVALGVLPLLLLTSLRFTGRLRETSRKQRKKEGQLSAAFHDGLSGVTLTRIFGREARYEALLGRSISSHVRAGLKSTRIEAAYARSVDVITSLGTTLVLVLGVHEVWRGALSPGDLLVFFSYLRTAYKPVRDVADVSARLSKATACGERIQEILDMPAAGVDRPGAISARGLHGEIRFERVAFGYRPGEPVLHDLDLVIPAGRTTAIVGPSGAGKSTIGKLLLRLYEPDEGAILVDGRPIDAYRVRSLRDQISVLAQESFLLRMSVFENIAFSRPGAAFEEVVAAASWVGAHEFIERLPAGYDTLVGEGGQTLSGGQRQRIAFARAALRDARILVFDEPATGLDPESEQAARHALAAIREDRTVLLITHRLALLDLADRLAFIEHGVLVEAGTLAELLARGGRFAAFYRTWQDAHATHDTPLAFRRSSATIGH